MDSCVLQDWITIRGDSTSVTTISQSEIAWLDLPDHDDAIFYLDVRQVTGTVSMTYQTSPSCEDASFQTLVPTFTLAVAATPRIDRAAAAYAGLPLARYIRWQLTAPAASGRWDATFRIWVAAYGPLA